jgi:endonuclease/exonuclease/phosphatase (EEP) superfamily protein YafD
MLKSRTIWARIGTIAEAMLLVAIAAVGACTVLTFWAHSDWRLELLSHFHVQYFWILAGLALIVAMRRRVVGALTATVLALVNFAIIVPLYFGPAPPATSRTISRCMSQNVYFHNHDYQRTLDLVHSERPDVVLFLEVTPDWGEALRALEPEYPFWRVVARPDSSGMAFYSRHAIDQLIVTNLAQTGLPTIVVRLLLPSGPLTLFCAHPVSPRNASDFEIRNRQLEELGTLARSRAGAVMVLGDLNTTSWSPCFQDLLAESGLVDSRRGFGVDGTWPALPLPLRIPIDHCLVSPGVAVYGRRIASAVGSDHRGIIVDFAVVEP